MTYRGLERFWGESGRTAPLRLLVWQRGRRMPDEHWFSRPFAIVGRSDPADLVLDHSQVSRRHAYVQLIGGRAYCLDLGSRSALGWGGGPRRSGWVEPGRPVEIGPFRVGVPSDGPGATPPPDPQIGAAMPTARFVLEAIDPASGRRRWPVDRVLTTVGRSPECRLRLSDLSASRFHCALLRLGETLWAVDLLGRGGIEVNDEPARWAPLGDGDRLRVGRYGFAVRSESAATLRIRDVEALPARVAGADGRGRPRATTALAASRRPAPPLAFGPASAALRAVDPDQDPVAIELPHDDPVRLAEAMVAPLIDQFASMQEQLFDQYHQSMMQMMALVSRMHGEQQEVVRRELRRIRRLTREVRSLRRELDLRRDAVAPQDAAPPPALGVDRPAGPAGPPLRSTPRGSPEEYQAAQARLLERMTELQQERQSRWQRLLGRLSGGGEAGRDRG